MTITDPTTTDPTISDPTTTNPTTTGQTRTATTEGAVTFDLYRDIHKGIRAELFAVTGAAGSVDPSDRLARAALADHVRSVAGLLASHALHEDAAIDPPLELHLPALAEQISADHADLERRVAAIVDLAAAAVDAPTADQRRLLHSLYLDLASFTSSYLDHQDREERVVMPALEQAVGVAAVVAIHEAIVSSIPPAEMAASLALMIPAMNVDDRCELLGGMRAGAPPEAFAAVLGLARSVLEPWEHADIAARLGLSVG